MGNAGSAPEQEKKAEVDGGAEGGGPPATVRFFPSAAQHTARQAPPIKLEEEDVPPPPGTAGEEQEDMAPRNLWQVCAKSSPPSGSLPLAVCLHRCRTRIHPWLACRALESSLGFEKGGADVSATSRDSGRESNEFEQD